VIRGNELRVTVVGLMRVADRRSRRARERRRMYVLRVRARCGRSTFYAQARIAAYAAVPVLLFVGACSLVIASWCEQRPAPTLHGTACEIREGVGWS
jgi:hypothetical protein